MLARRAIDTEPRSRRLYPYEKAEVALALVQRDRVVISASKSPLLCVHEPLKIAIRMHVYRILFFPRRATGYV